MRVKRLVRVRYMVGWVCAFTTTVVGGILLSFLNPTGIQIELIGAFVGVFAALALGGIFNSVSDYFDAKQFIKNLKNELELFGDILDGEGFVAFYPQIWEMGKATGKLDLLDEKLILYLLVLYESTLKYNQMIGSLEQYHLHFPPEAMEHLNEMRGGLNLLKMQIKEGVNETKLILQGQI